MKIVIPGGSGQVGTVLCRALTAQGHDCVVLSRSPSDEPWSVVAWDGRTLGDWQREIDGADVLINMAGRSVNCRYHERNRKQILDSRVDSTRVLGQAVQACDAPPKVWLQASTATIYAHRYDAANDEATGVLGTIEPKMPDTWRFSFNVATAWEEAFNELDLPDTRKVLLRSAIIMNPDSGSAFDVLSKLVRLGLGGAIGNGKQFVSWIHEEDFVRAINWLIRQPMTGAVNLASPNPLPNREFMQILRKAWKAKIGLPATEWMLEIGTFLMRTESELVLKSRRVIPARLQEAGFEFLYPTWEEAAMELVSRNRPWLKPRPSAADRAASF
jgi:uncharacterized protein (TIGR01777 family)